MAEPPPSFDANDVYSAELAGDDEQTRTQTPSTQPALSQVTEPQQSQEQHQPDVETHVVPPSEWEVIRAQLRDKPHQPDLWQRLVELAESGDNIEQIKETYEALLENYPNTSSAQIAYIGHFLSPGLFQFAEELFKRFLKMSPAVDLWKFYLSYVRRVNTGPSTRDVVRKSYEFALSFVGQDKDSGSIWWDYLQFLKLGETTNTWEEQQKMDALRKVYHRAVQIPLDNLEALWSDFESFETGLNKITAKKFLQDLNPAYVQARTVLRKLTQHLGPLFPPPPRASSDRPAIYLPPLPTFNAAERALVGAWKNYIKWEESNPLEIEDKDKPTLVTRIQGVYRKAVIRMRFYPEIWFMSYVWTQSIGKQDEALNILRAGIEAIPHSFVLHYAYTESLEARMVARKEGDPEKENEAAKIHAAYERFLEVLRKDLESLETRVNSANSSFSSQNTTDTQPVNGQDPAQAPVASNGNSFSTQPDTSEMKSKDLAERRKDYGNVWINYIRFARRAQGSQASRVVFGKARKDTRWTPWEVYEAAALMEYHTSKATAVAFRIFEKGLDTFGEELEYVLRYLGFLISVNDENNARALFERVIGTFPPDRARPLWERWTRYEYQYGSLTAALSLEKRIAEVYPTDPPIKRFAQRHTYLGTDAIAGRDLGFAIARQGGPASGSSGSSSTGGGGGLGRADTVQSLMANQAQGSPNPHKRPPSPDYRRRGDDPRGATDSGPAYKRTRPSTPPPPRDRDRGERWEGRRRFGSPVRDRERDVPPPRRVDREKDEEKGVVLPPIVSWFVGQLPAASAFDGPVFRTDDLMSLFRNAMIPPSGGARARSPIPPPRGGGRPPPDYGPYQGPGGGRSARRY